MVEKGGSFGAGGIMTPEVKEVLYDAGLKSRSAASASNWAAARLSPRASARSSSGVSKGEKQKAYEYFRIKTEILPDLVP